MSYLLSILLKSERQEEVTACSIRPSNDDGRDGRDILPRLQGRLSARKAKQWFS
jgi:hypothetical protein